MVVRWSYTLLWPLPHPPSLSLWLCPIEDCGRCAIARALASDQKGTYRRLDNWCRCSASHFVQCTTTTTTTYRIDRTGSPNIGGCRTPFACLLLASCYCRMLVKYIQARARYYRVRPPNASTHTVAAQTMHVLVLRSMRFSKRTRYHRYCLISVWIWYRES